MIMHYILIHHFHRTLSSNIANKQRHTDNQQTDNLHLRCKQLISYCLQAFYYGTQLWGAYVWGAVCTKMF